MVIDNKIKLKFSYYFRKYFVIFIKIFRISLFDTVRQDGIEHAGYLAFLGFLSLFSFLIFLFSITGYIGASDAGSHFIKMLLEMLPVEISGNIKPRIDEIISGPPQQFLTIAIIVLFGQHHHQLKVLEQYLIVLIVFIRLRPIYFVVYLVF